MIETFLRRMCPALVVLLVTACAAAPPPPALAPPPPPEPLGGAEIAAAAILLELEDRREIDLGTFRDLAGSGSAFVRARTALALARIESPVGRAIVRGLLSDGDTAVAAAAAFAAGRLRDTASVGLLTGLLPAGSAALNAPTVAAEAARALGRLATAESRVALTSFLERADPASPAFVRPAEHALIAAAALEGVALEPLARWTEATDDRVRWAAAYAVARSDRPGAARALIPLLDDPHPPIRAAALRGLSARALSGAALRVEETLGEVLQSTSDTSYAVRIEAIRALGRFPDRDATAALLAILREGGEHERAAAIEALGELGPIGSAAVPDLREIALDPAEHSFLRSAAARIAVHLDPAAASAFLSRLEEDPAWRVRAAVADSRAQLGERELPGLRRAARDADPRVARAAVEATMAVAEEMNGGALILPVLLDAVQAQDPHLRAVALQGLGRFGDVSIFPILLDAYQTAVDDPEDVARLAAIDALAALRGRGISSPERAFFARFPRSEDYLVRRRVVERFGEIARSRWGSELPIETGVPRAVYADYVGRWLTPADSAARRPRAVILTEVGPIELVLFGDVAPLATANFLRLADVGYFDGQEIAQVVPHQFVQAGDPRGDSAGGPGYTLRGEPSRLAFGAGSLGMVRSEGETSGGQFFIALSALPDLDGSHTLFGEVAGGWDTLWRLLPGDRILSVRLAQQGE